MRLALRIKKIDVEPDFTFSLLFMPRPQIGYTKIKGKITQKNPNRKAKQNKK